MTAFSTATITDSSLAEYWPHVFGLWPWRSSLPAGMARSYFLPCGFCLPISFWESSLRLGWSLRSRAHTALGWQLEIWLTRFWRWQLFWVFLASWPSTWRG